MSPLLIRNATIAQPDGTSISGDVLCEDGRITRIDAQIDFDCEDVYDAGGHLLLPGAIDPQVHFREPGAEHKEDLGTGSRAAVRGGVTSFLEMPNTRPATIDQARLDEKLALAGQKSVANYGFFIGATPDNLDAINSVHPVCGIKVFMGSSTGSLLVNKESDLDRIFATGDRLIAVHAEDDARIHQQEELYAHRHDPAVHSQIRDRECALIATQRALRLSKRYQRRLHILHLSTAEEADLLRADKPDWLSAEVIPNHLFLNEGDYDRLGTLVQMNPPIRTEQDNANLWQALKDGVIDFIATDHAPHTLEEKSQTYPDSPSGMPGVEVSLALILTEHVAGRCSLAEVQKWMCWGAAQAYRIPNKGKIIEGWDADLTVVDIDHYKPVLNEETFTKTRWSPYAGRELTGWAQCTIVNGQIAFRDGAIMDGVHGKPLRFETRS